MARPPLLLELDLTDELLEAPPSDPLGALQARRRPTLRAVVDRLREAGADPRVGGLVARVGGRMPLARAQELAAAVAAFRREGRPAVAWAQTFGEMAAATGPYVLAAEFDELWLQPSGDVGLVGVAARAVLLRGVLDRAGVEPQVARRHEYKTAADTFVEPDLTDANREMLDRLAESAYEQVVAAVAAARRLDPDGVRAAIDAAPLTAEQARAAGLVDRVGYRDEVYAELRRRLGGDVRLLFLDRYRPRPKPWEAVRRAVRRSTPAVALVQGAGAITLGRSGRSLPSGRTMGADTVTAALRAAGRDDEVRAVVFRVDSPGGSYVASDAVWREVVRLRESGRTVVVSMGTVAASGGYFVACPADAIVALPGTLTGSIGVLGGKAVVAGALDRLGVRAHTLSRGRYAAMFSPLQRFDDEEWARLNDWLDRVYDDFVGKVADGRGLSREQVHEVARGRVWTGADARERGLVDELGGLARAVELARERAGLPVDAPLRRVPSAGVAQRLRRPRSSEDRAAVRLGVGLAMHLDGPLLMPPLTLD